jgi:beta-glucosidase
MCKGVPNNAIPLLSLISGTDVEMGGGSFSYGRIPTLLAEGKLPIRAVDQAVARVLRAKFDMGLFEADFSSLDAKQAERLIHTTEAIQIARQLDTESIVLLENHNGILPLKKRANVAVIGPMAHSMNVGRARKGRLFLTSQVRRLRCRGIPSPRSDSF